MILAGVGLTSLALTVSGCFLPRTTTPTSESASPSTSSATSSAGASGAITSIDGAKAAVVRIVAEGSYVDPAEGLVSSAGSGSGFIVDPAGLIVTNAHVVEGAGSVQVYVGGSDTPLNAKILGISECNDVAMLDLVGDGYPFLDWYEGTAEPGLDVYAAGFPLGDPEYTLVKGIVAKAKASGDTPWASIDYSIQHDAEIQPGNSGGPLLTEQAAVVGINYSFSNPTNTSQYFAIPAAIAQESVKTLATGNDLDSIGINGIAIYNADTDAGGLWVSGVRAGSPASNAGIEPGDIIYTLAGRDVVTRQDGATKAGYCDVLRTQGSDRAMSVVVYRSGTEEVLKGEINNPDKPLVPVPLAGDGQTGSSTAEGFTEATDSTGRLVTQFPDGWNEIDKQMVDTDLGKASYLAASADQSNFLDGKATAAGALFLLHTNLTHADLNKARNSYAKLFGMSSSCTVANSTDVPTSYGDYSYVDTNYTNCGTAGIDAYIAAVWHADADAMVIIAGTYANAKQQNLLNTVFVNTDVM